MRIENKTGSVSNANTATYAYTARTLDGITPDPDGTFNGDAFKRPRVKEDETGFELTYNAQVGAVLPDANLILSLGSVDGFSRSQRSAPRNVPTPSNGGIPASAN